MVGHHNCSVIIWMLVAAAVFEEFGWVDVFFDVPSTMFGEVKAVFTQWICIEKIVFAEMAVPTEPIVARGRGSYTLTRASNRSPWDIQFSIWGLLRGIPDLYWGTCLGADYLDAIGR